MLKPSHLIGFILGLSFISLGSVAHAEDLEQDVAESSANDVAIPEVAPSTTVQDGSVNQADELKQDAVESGAGNERDIVESSADDVATPEVAPSTADQDGSVNQADEPGQDAVESGADNEQDVAEPSADDFAVPEVAPSTADQDGSVNQADEHGQDVAESGTDDVATTDVAPLTVAQYGPVKLGEILSSIMTDLKPQNVAIEQAMLAVLCANRGAFIKNNINLLKTGIILSIPSDAEMLEVPSDDALEEVERQKDEWDKYQYGEEISDGDYCVESKYKRELAKKEKEIVELEDEIVVLEKGACEDQKKIDLLEKQACEDQKKIVDLKAELAAKGGFTGELKLTELTWATHGDELSNAGLAGTFIRPINIRAYGLEVWLGYRFKHNKSISSSIGTLYGRSFTGTEVREFSQLNKHRFKSWAGIGYKGAYHILPQEETELDLFWHLNFVNFDLATLVTSDSDTTTRPVNTTLTGWSYGIGIAISQVLISYNNYRVDIGTCRSCSNVNIQAISLGWQF